VKPTDYLTRWLVHFIVAGVALFFVLLAAVVAWTVRHTWRF